MHVELDRTGGVRRGRYVGTARAGSQRRRWRRSSRPSSLARIRWRLPARWCRARPAIGSIAGAMGRVLVACRTPEQLVEEAHAVIAGRERAAATIAVILSEDLAGRDRDDALGLRDGPRGADPRTGGARRLHGLRPGGRRTGLLGGAGRRRAHDRAGRRRRREARRRRRSTCSCSARTPSSATARS